MEVYHDTDEGPQKRVVVAHQTRKDYKTSFDSTNPQSDCGETEDIQEIQLRIFMAEKATALQEEHRCRLQSAED